MLSMYEAPAPLTIACCGLVLPYPAAASLVRSAASGLSGWWCSSRSIIVTIISTWASSSVPMARSMSLYLPGRRQFQPWSRYWVATVISPHWPPRISCILRAKSGSGPSGLASYCRAWVCVNTGSPLRRRDHRRCGDAQGSARARWPTRAHPWPPRATFAVGPRSAPGGSFSAVGELHGQRQGLAVLGPHDPAAELAGLPPHRPQPQAGEVRWRVVGAQGSEQPLGADDGLRQRQVDPAGATSDRQPDRGAVPVPVRVLQQVGEDPLHTGVGDGDVLRGGAELHGQLGGGQPGGGRRGADDVA